MTALPRLRIQYGGSFDPIHNGHLALARAAREALQAEVWLMPAADPPHKGPTGADAAARLAMLQRALAGTDLRLDPRELYRPGPSWTIDSLQQLRASLGPGQPLALLLGADSFLSLPTWKAWAQIPALAHLIVAERPGSPLQDEAMPAPLRAFASGRWQPEPLALRQRPAGCLFRLPMPLRAESSTHLRQRIACADPRWRDWLPARVADFICEHRLYGADCALPE